jgi:putative PIG3 family NAD(P)H quinone oxidoreductase
MIAATVVGEGRVEPREHPDPVPGHGEVLVRVHAAGLNRTDLSQAAGHYPAPPGSPPDIPGLELAGTVARNGPGATRFQPGDRVMAIVGGGAQAQFATVHERQLMAVPANLDWPSAGAFPEVFATAHDALFSQSRLGPGERLLVHGGAGGVGTAAIQLGALTGAQVHATVRDESLRDAVAKLGATVLAPEGFAAHGPFDVILELVGATNIAADLEALAPQGRIAVIGVGSGTSAELDLRALMSKRATIRGSMLRARSLEEKASVTRSLERHVLPALAGGTLRVPIAATFPLTELAAAYARFAAGAKLGKVVLTID